MKSFLIEKYRIALNDARALADDDSEIARIIDEALKPPSASDLGETPLLDVSHV